MMKQPLVVLTGPTAVGKTRLSIDLAKAVGGEIISADSMQVYRYMDIGSAKIRKEEMEGVPHHLIDVLDPREEFHVQKFQQMAKASMEGIYERGHIPILTGGTGFYIQAVLYDIDFTEEETGGACRKELEQYAKEHGALALHRRLEAVDPKSACAIHPNNVKRVVRALEYYEQTGEQMSLHNEKAREKASPYSFAYFVLNEDRRKLYEKIDRRVDLMMEKGLANEVQKLKDMGCDSHMVSMQGLGYKEVLAYLNGEYSLNEAVYRIKRDTRHFAKRQITWFKRERNVIWVTKEAFQNDETKILAFMLDHIEKLEGVSCFRNYSGDPDF